MLIPLHSFPVNSGRFNRVKAGGELVVRLHRGTVPQAPSSTQQRSSQQHCGRLSLLRHVARPAPASAWWPQVFDHCSPSRRAGHLWFYITGACTNGMEGNASLSLCQKFLVLSIYLPIYFFASYSLSYRMITSCRSDNRYGSRQHLLR